MSTATTPQSPIEVCLHGHGIVCGLEVHINHNCDIHLTGGTAITPSGGLIHIGDKTFSYYLIEPSPEVQAYFPHNTRNEERINRTVLELFSSKGYNPGTTDSLKQQSPEDTPTPDLLSDKILVVLFRINDPSKQYFLLVSPSLLLEKGDSDTLNKVKELSKSDISEARSRLHKRPQRGERIYPSELIDQAFRPYLQLREVIVPRFGYKELAIADRSQPFGTDNFVNPFSKIKTFKTIFEEYKAILDDLIPEFAEALEKLHAIYGDQFTHKGKHYWDKYRKILTGKWQVFLEKGEHLYYIQYYHDWLADLVKAYDELCEELSAFVGKCHCHSKENQPGEFGLLRLGPVLGGSTSYTPLLFRDSFEPPLIDGHNEEDWNRIRFHHWRLMMMIWTFDLPQLKLDEILVKRGYLESAKEFEDSTNYFERMPLGDLPLKFTPSQTPETPLAGQAIPYYYPLDADSPYSLHQYWNYRLTQMHRTKHIRSYNAIPDRDSYTAVGEKKYHLDAQFPVAFHLRQYPFLRAEGHMGKPVGLVQVPGAVPAEFKADLKIWAELLRQQNLSLQVIGIPVSELPDFVSQFGDIPGNALHWGLEHIGGLAYGQTLVLVYTDTDEQIELSECKKDSDPEVAKNTIIADFTIPVFLGKTI
ncbi:hypothetical protein GCM10010967_56710 [Dyadobacter beijingensis]|uniref:Uncharacterized protein n=1 Tax=Dyadobacter beijingensis TaxID=365489 RepID=A0ABQ2IM78_9BACT|nr:hypothetical protein [Dyadobacter beijingensis]GGN13270.1 hypothetical protein GCM10010967_56710 [Dyadobacter beijingensis]